MLSPYLWNIYFTSLLIELKTVAIAVLAFADDLSFTVKNRQDLRKCLQICRDWMKRHGMQMNKGKSAIMAIRVDKRTPPIKEKEFEGIPVVEQYVYLGVLIDDTMQMRTFISEKKKGHHETAKKLRLVFLELRNPAVQLQIQRAFGLSKYGYGAPLILVCHEKILEDVEI